MEYDIHTVLDLLTLTATCWVVYTMRFTPLKNTYQRDQDSIKLYYVVRACAPCCLPAARRPGGWLHQRCDAARQAQAPAAAAAPADQEPRPPPCGAGRPLPAAGVLRAPLHVALVPVQGERQRQDEHA
jgi:hypothetical protein